MDDILNVDMLLELPKKMREISAEYDEYSQPLRKSLICEYYSKDLKEKISEELFYPINDAKYSHNFTISVPSNNYNVLENRKTQNNVSIVESHVANVMDWQIKIRDLYDRLLAFSKKLTLEEVTYLVDTFFGRYKDEVISEKLGISTPTLQNIRKSCLVKIRLDFGDVLKLDY